MLKRLSLYNTSAQTSSRSSFSNNKKSHLKPELYRVDTAEFIALYQSWPQIVGEMLGKNTCPQKIYYGTLCVLTKHAMFSQELSFMSDSILNKIFSKFPHLREEIKSINFKASPQFFKQNQAVLTLPDQSSAEQKLINQLHPYSPFYRKAKQDAQQFFEEIELQDEELKDTFESLYVQASLRKNLSENSSS